MAQSTKIFWRLPLLAALVGWAWQAVAYFTLVPRSGLEYGWFKTPGGEVAGLVTLRIPLYAVLAIIAVSGCLGSSRYWREHSKSEILWLSGWCLLVSFIYCLPSAYLEAQGNASVFI